MKYLLQWLACWDLNLIPSLFIFEVQAFNQGMWCYILLLFVSSCLKSFLVLFLYHSFVNKYWFTNASLGTNIAYIFYTANLKFQFSCISLFLFISFIFFLFNSLCTFQVYMFFWTFFLWKYYLFSSTFQYTLIPK